MSARRRVPAPTSARATGPQRDTSALSPPALRAPMVPEPEPTGPPADRAWARVARECPDDHSAAEHRSGAFVHVAPMGHPSDVRCLPGEPVPGYTGFFRPAGGHKNLHPTGTVLPSQRELDHGTKPPPPVFPTKTVTYQAAEMTGR